MQFRNRQSACVGIKFKSAIICAYINVWFITVYVVRIISIVIFCWVGSFYRSFLSCAWYTPFIIKLTSTQPHHLPHFYMGYINIWVFFDNQSDEIYVQYIITLSAFLDFNGFGCCYCCTSHLATNNVKCSVSQCVGGKVKSVCLIG